jgi:hypothetical protein
MEREHEHNSGGGGGAPVVVNVQGGAPQMLIKPPPNCCMKCCCPPCAVWMHEVRMPLVDSNPPPFPLRHMQAPGRGRPFAHCLPLVFLQGMGGNFIMALVAWLCGVGWCFTMCCWVPDPYGKQPRVAVTDMER